MPKTSDSEGSCPNDALADRLMCALAIPLRRRILASLTHGPASASTLSKEYGVPLGNVAYHLSQVLFERCNVVELVATYQRRGAAEKVFALRPDAFIGIMDWPSIPAPIRSGLHGITIAEFVTFAVSAIEAEAVEPEIASIYSMQPIAVDRDGHEEIATALEEFQSRVTDIAARCAAVHPDERRQIIVGSAAFEAAQRPESENA